MVLTWDSWALRDWAPVQGPASAPATGLQGVDVLAGGPVKGLKLTQLLLEILPTSFFFFLFSDKNL